MTGIEAYNYSVQYLEDDLYSTDFLYLKKLSIRCIFNPGQT